MNKKIIIIFFAALWLGGCSWRPSTEINRIGPTSSDEEMQIPTIVESSPSADVDEGEIPLTLLFPEDGIITSKGNIIVLGQTLPQAEVMVNEFKLVAADNGAFNQSINLSEGENHLAVLVKEGGKFTKKDIVVFYEPVQSNLPK